MVQLYAKESGLGIDKTGYDDEYTVTFYQWLAESNQTTSYASPYTDLSQKYADEENPKIGMRDNLQHPEAKIKNMERRLMNLEEQLKMSDYYIAELTKQLQKLSKLDQIHPDSLWQQNEIGRKELMSIFRIDSNDSIDTKKLDGLLSDYVNQEQDSRDLVRSIRGG